jgi:hypothetical protein
MFEMQVTDYLGVVHTLRYVTEPSEEQKADIIASYSLAAKEVRDKAVFMKKLEYSDYMVKEIVYELQKRNLSLGKTSAFIQSMFSQLIPIKELLMAGSYGMGKAAIQQAQAAYGTDYTDIFQEVIDDIDRFNLENGL